MKFTIITLFPKLIQSFLKEGLLGQAVTSGKIEIEILNPRQFTSDVHQSVDDRVFGGGDGMVMMVEPLLQAVRSVRAQGPCRVGLLTPQGALWKQKRAQEVAASGQ